MNARKPSDLRWTLLAGASLIVLGGLLAPSPGMTGTIGTVSSSVTSAQTITNGNGLSVTSAGTVAPATGAGVTLSTGASITSILNDGFILPTAGSGLSATGTLTTITEITNNGTIQGVGAAGVTLTGVTLGTFTNAGTLTSTNNMAFRQDGGSIGSLINTGSIVATGSSQKAISLGAGGGTYLSVNNSGTISGTQGGFALAGGTLGTLTNTGQIIGGNYGGAVLGAANANATTTLLNNSGTISGASGIVLYGTLGTLTNSGLIRGTTANALAIANSVSAVNTLTNTGTLSGNITGIGAADLIITGGTGTVYGTVMGAQGINSPGTISLDSNLTFAGNNFLANNVTIGSTGAGRLTNTGTLMIQRNTSISGAYSQPSSATLVIGVVSTSVYGRLSAAGGVTLTNGTIVMQAAPSGTMAGGTYTIASGLSSGTTTSDYSGVSVTATGFDGTVGSTSTLVGTSSQFLVTLTPTVRLYWDGDAGGNAANGTVDGGSGTWTSASTNWTKADGTTNGLLSGSPLVPIFQGTAGTVTASGSIATAGMTFESAGYLITGGSIGLSSSPTITVNAASATIASTLTGSAGLTKAGTGVLLLSGTNSFSGNVTIAGGTLTANGGTVLPNSGNLSIGSGATLQLGSSETVGNASGAGSIVLGANTLTTSITSTSTITGGISGTGGALVKAGSGTLVLSGSNSFTGGTSITSGTLTAAGTGALASTGAVTVGSGATFKADASLTIGALSGAGNVALDTNTLTVGDAANTTLSGTLSGSGTLVKAGSGTLTLSGANSFTGGLTVNAGTMVYGDAVDRTLTGALSGGGGFTKTGGGMLTLSGANSFTGALTVSAGTLAAGGTIGAVSIASGATLIASGATTTGALVNNGTTALGGSVLTVAGNITGTGAITFTIGGAGSGYIVNSTNTANYAPGAGAVTVTPTVSGGTVVNGTKIALIRGSGGGAAPSFTGTTFSVTATGAATWALSDGSAYAGAVDLNGYTITANDTVLVATAPTTPTPTPPTPTPPTTTETTTGTTTPVVPVTPVTPVPPVTPETPVTPDVPVTPVTPVIPVTPETPVTPDVPVTPGTPVTPSKPPVGVIDTSKPIFTDADSAVRTTTVTFDGGTLKPTAPLTLTQSVVIAPSNGTIDPNGSTVTLSGSITGTGQLTVTGSGTLVVSSTVSNGGGLNVRSGGLAVADGGTVAAPVTVAGGTVTVEQGGRVSAPVTVSAGAVTVDQGGTVDAAVTVESGGSVRVNGEVGGPVTVAGGATLGGSGRIAGDTSVSGVLAPGNSPGTLVFTAPVTLNAGSTYQVEIDGTGTGTGAGNHDRVVVSGASFTAGGRLTPILRGIGGSATNGFTPSLGQLFTVVDADGGVAGRFATLDQPAGGLAVGTRMDLLYAPTAVALAVTPASYANLAAAGLGQTANQRAVGAALESFRPAAGGPARGETEQALFDNLYTLSGARIGPALNQLSGEIHADTLAADRVNRRQFGRAVEARQAALRGSATPPVAPSGAVQFLFDGKAQSASGLPEGATGGTGAAAGGASLWGQPLVGRGRSGTDGNGGTADRFTGGFMVGSDHAFDPAFKAGVAMGFLRTTVKADGGLGKGTVDSYQATVYGSWTPGAAFVDAALGYGYTRYDASRPVAFGNVAGTLAGAGNGHDLSADISAGTRVALDGGAWAEPRVGLRWDRLERGAFTESGLPLLGLKEETATLNALRSSVGLRFGTKVTVGETTVEPTGLLGWEHDWRDAGASASASLAGAHVTAMASQPGRDAAVAGVGVAVAMTQRVSVQIGYLGEIRRRESNHGLSAGLRWSW